MSAGDDPVYTDWKECSAEITICPALANDESIQYKLDPTYDLYLENWQAIPDFMCGSMSRTNLLVVVYGASYALGGILFYHIPDQVGRLPSFRMFSTPSLISQLIVLFVPSYWGKLFGFLLFGLTSTKNSLSYVYLFEFMHSRDKSFACSCINFADVAGSAVAGCFWLFVERDWFPLFFGTVAVSALAYTVVLIVSLESPKWLLMRGRTDEAIKVLNYIAWFNGVEHRVEPGTKFIEAQEENAAIPPSPLNKSVRASGSRRSSLNFENTPVYKENQLESNQYSSERT